MNDYSKLLEDINIFKNTHNNLYNIWYFYLIKKNEECNMIKNKIKEIITNKDNINDYTSRDIENLFILINLNINT